MLKYFYISIFLSTIRTNIIDNTKICRVLKYKFTENLEKKKLLEMYGCF